MSKVTPIRPSEVSGKKADSIPDEVIEAFNELILKNWSEASKTATVRQKDVIALILKKLNLDPDSKHQIFDNGWLDVEPYFRKYGWKVEYDKPAYCETYEASFEFSEKSKRNMREFRGITAK